MKNELIREFEKQSFITTETQKISGAWDNIVEPFRYVTVTETNFSPEKFAQLIVRECMDIARHVGNISEPDDFALDRCYEIEQRIQDRFGVEE